MESSITLNSSICALAELRRNPPITFGIFIRSFTSIVVRLCIF